MNTHTTLFVQLENQNMIADTAEPIAILGAD